MGSAYVRRAHVGCNEHHQQHSTYMHAHTTTHQRDGAVTAVRTRARRSRCRRRHCINQVHSHAGSWCGAVVPAHHICVHVYPSVLALALHSKGVPHSHNTHEWSTAAACMPEYSPALGPYPANERAPQKQGACNHSSESLHTTPWHTHWRGDAFSLSCATQAITNEQQT